MIRKARISFMALICALAYPLPAPANISKAIPSFEGENTKQFDPATKNISGRKVLVRVYKDCQTDPYAYEKITLILTDLSISFDAVKRAVPNLDESAIILLAGEDQSDDIMARTIGNNVYAEPFEKGKCFSIRPESFDQADPEPRIFRDALGKPIPKALVEIFFRDNLGKYGNIYFGKAVTDSLGRLEVPNPAGSLSGFAYILSHPDYGTARVDRYIRHTDLIVPLVSRLSEAYYRSSRGTVLDPDGNPIGGARIQCTNVRTLGEGLINSLNGWTYEALTDKQGNFSFYLPNEKHRDERGYLIPPKSRYNVRIEAPGERRLLPHVDPIENDRIETIILEQGELFRTFIFEDANGLITDPRKLQYISVTILRPDQSRLSIGYNDFKNGGVFPPGQYRAKMRMIADYEFEPLLVDEQSPDELIFKLPESVIYYGRIVHGLTGEPMAGAFVLTMNSKSKGNLSMITPEQWRALHALPVEPSVADPAVKPVSEIYGIKKLVRTDENGRFKMSFMPGEIYGFIAFEENYLGLMRRVHALVPDENGYAEIPAMKLFPAATVLVEIFTQERISIWPRWIIDKENNSAWVSEFLATDDRRESMFTYDAWLKENELQSFHVPAGLNLRIKFDTPYDKKWCPIEIPQVFNLAHGQAVDLGSHTFYPAVAVSVYVTNMQGDPLEGAPVRLMLAENAWGVPHNTDESGMARFHVIPHSAGQFGVLYHGPDGTNLTETIPYKIAGEEDEGRQFIMQLSEDMINHLFK